MYAYGTIGNCQIAALIHESTAIDWLCMPRPDSAPIFGRLLDPDGGTFAVVAESPVNFRQEYVPNTNVLVTTVESADGAFTVTDFCPRFAQYNRVYRPVSLFRIVSPLRGNPTIKVSCRPVDGWTKRPLVPRRGNSHLRFETQGNFFRVATNMSLTYLIEEHQVPLREPLYFCLTWNSGLEDDIVRVSQDFLSRTIEQWQTWVKHLNTPPHHQHETIRSALILKLHCYEDTGAILASLSTSLPEQIGHLRNWDYRYCWLRDAYFSLAAFQKLNQFEEMESFLKFLLDIGWREDLLRPVYRLDRTPPLPEIEHGNWCGFENSSPVRSGNQAAEHVQNDAYGEMILALAPIFFDERFQELRSKDVEYMMTGLGMRCARSIGQADAGIWELRSTLQQHSFTNLMCWAGLRRLRQIREEGFLANSSFDAERFAEQALQALESAVQDNILRTGPSDPTLDSSLLVLPLLSYPNRSVSESTVRATQAALRVEDDRLGGAFLYRYKKADDFGLPSSAFVICSFWLIQALSKLGYQDEARQLMGKTLGAANRLHTYAEHFDVATNRQLGNFPQAYSHVGQINAAFAVSPCWED